MNKPDTFLPDGAINQGSSESLDNQSAAIAEQMAREMLQVQDK